MTGQAQRISRSLNRTLLGLLLVAGLAAFASTAGANNPPHLSRNNELIVLEGGVATIDNLLLQATDAESPATQITFTVNGTGTGTPPMHGTLRVSGSPIGTGGTFTQDDLNQNRVTYTHDGGETTSDVFTFEVHDGDGAIATDGPFSSFTFVITVTPVNDRPVALDHTYSAGIGQVVSAALAGTDPDLPAQSLTYSLVTTGTLGTAVLLNASLGTFTYSSSTPGTDTFTFQVFDGSLFALAAGTITINIANQAPSATSSNLTTSEDVATGGTLTGSDPDLPAQTLTYSIITNGTKGTALITNTTSGTFTYTPSLSAIGQDSIAFGVNDGLVNSAPGIVRITIRPRLDAGDLVVTDTRVHMVLLIDPATLQIGSVSTGGLLANQPRGLAMDASDQIHLIASGTGVVRVDGPTGGQTLVSPGTNFSTSPLGPVGLGLEPDGHIVVGDGVNGVVRVDPITGVKTTVSSGGNLGLVLGVIVAANGDLYAGDGSGLMGGASKVVRIDPVSGAQTLITSGNNLKLPADLAIESTGDLLVTDVGSFAGGVDRVIRVNPSTGAQTVVTSAGLLHQPTGIALAANGDIFLACGQSATIVRVDPGTGAQSVFFTNPMLQQPFGIRVRAPAGPVAADPPEVPHAWDLGGVVPTPAHGSARIDYALPHEARVRMRLYDTAGRLVQTVVDGLKPAGRYSATVDGTRLASGIYLCRIEAGEFHATRKVVIAR